MIDFDAMVESGVISRETGDKIKAYMDEHKPDGKPDEAPEKPSGEKPADAPEEPDDGLQPAAGEQPDLLADLLEGGVITQAEYDALNGAVAAE